MPHLCPATTTTYAAVHGPVMGLELSRWVLAGTLRQLYRTAMQMEVDFFDAQPGTKPPAAISMLVMDFDDTCTASDSTSKVFDTAIAAAVENAAGMLSSC